MPDEKAARRMYFAPASADFLHFLSIATSVDKGMEAISIPMKNSRKWPLDTMKYIPSRVTSVRK